MGIQLLLVGMIMHAQAVEHDEIAFLDRSVAVYWQERLAQ